MATDARTNDLLTRAEQIAADLRALRDDMNSSGHRRRHFLGWRLSLAIREVGKFSKCLADTVEPFKPGMAAAGADTFQAETERD